VLSVRQAAERAGVCEAIVYAWVAGGRLVHYRLGAPGKRGKIAIKESDLDDFLADFRVGVRVQGAPAPPPPVTRGQFRHLKVR
jgi:excisionase family DNA binding protein